MRSNHRIIFLFSIYPPLLYRHQLSDLYKEAMDHYIEGKLYNFTVDEVLAGDLQTKEIRVNHR